MVKAKETKRTKPKKVARKKGSSKKTSAKKKHTVSTASPASPDGVLAEITKKAVGGKVAVLKRGETEPEILGGDNGSRAEREKEQAPPSHVQALPLPPDAVEDVREYVNEIRQKELQIGRLRAQYYEQDRVLNQQLAEDTKNFNAVVQRLGRRLQVPPNWMLNLDTMTFVHRELPGPQGG